MLQPGDRAVSSVVAGQPALQVQAFAEGVLLGSYRYSEKSTATGASAKEAGDAGEAEVRLLVTWAARDELAATIEEASTIATAVALARDLTNTPSVRKSPEWLADAAGQVAAEAGLAVRVWTDQELASAGFGGLTAVGAGSARPPRLIELRYEPPGAKRHVVLVGKGIHDGVSLQVAVFDARLP